MSVQAQYAQAWCLTLYLPSANTVYAATMDLPSVAAVGTLGHFFRRLILNDLSITHQLPDLLSGIDLPSVTAVVLDNTPTNPSTGNTYGDFNPSVDVRQSRVTLQRYDLTANTATTEFTGIITDAVYLPGRVICTLGSSDSVLMQTLLPKVIVTTTAAETQAGGYFPNATDIGRAIPVVAGTNAVVRPAFVELSLTDDDDGADYIISHETVTVNGVYGEQNTERPGLEEWPAGSYSTGSTYSGYTHLRFFERPDTEPVVMATNTAYENPATWIKAILEDDTWGLGATCDTTSFTAAATTLAGDPPGDKLDLHDAISGALGADGTQRMAIDILSELLSLRGMRLWKAADGEWEISVDHDPGASVMTLGFADGTYNNLLTVLSYRRTPLEDAVSRINLRYGAHGSLGRRFRRQLYVNDYAYSIKRDVLSIGREQIRTCPWVGTFEAADMVAWYWSKTLYYADEQLEVIANPEARDLDIGDVVTVTIPQLGLSAVTMRVQLVEKRLANQRLLLVGYNSAIFSGYSKGTAPAALNVDDRRVERSVGLNLVENADLSQGPLDGEAQAPAHRWMSTIQLGATTTVTVTDDPLALTRHRITIIDDADLPSASIRSTRQVWTAASGLEQVPNIVLPVAQGSYILSLYADGATGLKLQVFWYTSADVAVSSVAPTIVEDTTDTNPYGWHRFFVRCRAPATAAKARVAFGTDGITAVTRICEAIQFELATGRNFPSAWDAYTPWNKNAEIASLARSSETGAGMETLLPSEIIDLTGLNVATIDTTDSIIPANCYVTVTVYIVAALTGPTSIDVGWSALTNAWADNFSPLTTGSATTGFTGALAMQASFSAATKVRITFNGGNCTAGKIRVTVHASRIVTATA